MIYVDITPAKNTDELSDLYGHWLEENGFEGHEPADDLLFGGDITDEARNWLIDFCAAHKRLEEAQDAAFICDRWIGTLGLGFHPDTRGKDYRPELTPEQIRAYDLDMELLFSISADPYAHAIASAERAGLM